MGSYNSQMFHFISRHGDTGMQTQFFHPASSPEIMPHLQRSFSKLQSVQSGKFLNKQTIIIFTESSVNFPWVAPIPQSLDE